MAIGMANMNYLSEKGLLTRQSKVLDIGSQNLLSASVESIRAFAEKYGRIDDEAAFAERAEKLAYFSSIRPGERTTYVSELLDLTELFYTSYDVCPALKTEIMDLNRQRLPKHYHEHFDIVLNFGTTEHIFNQTNSYEVMHDALKIGGSCFHQVPSIGWGDHGYFCYHDIFFRDIAQANHYEILDMWYCPVGHSRTGAMKLDCRDASTPEAPNSATLPASIPNYNLNVILRKTSNSPFKVGLELETSHSGLSSEVEAVYGSERSAPTTMKGSIF